MPHIQCNGANLYYEDCGEGQPIIFIHGAMAGLRFFEPQHACMHEWGGYTVSFFKIKEDWAPSPLLFKGLPDDRCQAPHYGYVFKGKARLKYKDYEETINTGEAYYMKPGHIPVHAEKGTEFLEISPKEENEKTMTVVRKNMKEMQAKKLV